MAQVAQLIDYVHSALEDGKAASQFDDEFLAQLHALMRELRRLPKAAG